MEMLNSAHLSWNECTEINDSLLITIDSCRSAFELYDATVSLLRQENSLFRSSIEERDTLIAHQDMLIKRQHKQINKLKLHKGLLGTLDVVLAGVIGYLVLFH